MTKQAAYAKVHPGLSLTAEAVARRARIPEGNQQANRTTADQAHPRRCHPGRDCPDPNATPGAGRQAFRTANNRIKLSCCGSCEPVRDGGPHLPAEGSAVSRDDELTGTAAMVTGAAGGIGSATARTLVGAGLGDRNCGDFVVSARGVGVIDPPVATIWAVSVMRPMSVCQQDRYDSEPRPPSMQVACSRP